MKHYHLWTTSVHGVQYGNAIFESHIDVAEKFTRIGQQLNFGRPVKKFAIEDVVRALENGNGVYAGTPGFILVVTGCNGDGCTSSTWN